MHALTMNHAMVYSKDIARGVAFYSGVLGLELLEEYLYNGRLAYARLKSPGSDTTIALHLQGPDTPLATGGIRLYFEVEDLAGKCREMEAAGCVFRQQPTMMPWGWEHAYLDDPDGHEVSLYWSHGKRLEKAGTTVWNT